MTEDRTTLGDLVRLISGCRFRYANEDELQEGVAALLAAHEITAQREVRLSALDRIDLLAGDVGIEVKTTGRTAAVARQLTRYARSDHVGSLILVTNRVTHVSLNGKVYGKPLVVVPLVHP